MKLLAACLALTVLSGCATIGQDNGCLWARPIRLSEKTQAVLASGDPETDYDQIAILAANEVYRIRCGR